MKIKVTEQDLYRWQLRLILKIDRSAAIAYEEFFRFGFPCSQQNLKGLEDLEIWADLWRPNTEIIGE